MRRVTEVMIFAGLIFVLLGMIGTVQMFQEEYISADESLPEVGFVPMVAGAEESGPSPVAEIAITGDRQMVRLTAEALALTPHVRPVDLLATATAIPVLLETPTQSPEPVIAEPSVALTEAPPTALADTPTPLPPVATSTPLPPVQPEWIDIPAIGLEAPIVPVAAMEVRVEGQRLQQWSAPNVFAAGWHNTSALVGQSGNTVLNGHHNIYGSVFARLRDLQTGDQIFIWSQERVFIYVVVQNFLLEERFAGLSARQENARWILPSDDERLTLVTCWPPESNTHRVVVVARPLFSE